MTSIAPETGVHEIKFEVPIAAPRERVWEALTSGIDDWWLPDFRLVSGSRRIVFEAKPGGRVYEEGEGGAGLLWFTILMIEPGQSIQMNGHIMPPWGGPAISYLWIQLEDGPDGTTVFKMTDTILGKLVTDCAGSIGEGWRQLFEDGLKTHVESS